MVKGYRCQVWSNVRARSLVVVNIKRLLALSLLVTCLLVVPAGLKAGSSIYTVIPLPPCNFHVVVESGSSLKRWGKARDPCMSRTSPSGSPHRVFWNHPLVKLLQVRAFDHTALWATSPPHSNFILPGTPPPLPYTRAEPQYI